MKLRATARTSDLHVRLIMSCTTFFLLTNSLAVLLSVAALSEPDGSLNIGCGAIIEYTARDTGLRWVPDAPFSKGQNYSYSGRSDDNGPYDSIAYFTNLDARKYCYLLPLESGKTYLLRTNHSFDKGFDPPNLATVFDLFIDGTLWTSVQSDSHQSVSTNYEIIFAAISDRLSLCLARTSETDGYPFISTIQLRALRPAMYNATDLSKEALCRCARTNFGYPVDEVRYPDDPFDRIWRPYWKTIFKNISTEDKVPDIQNLPPMKVLQSAITTSSVTDMPIQWPLSKSLPWGNYYLALYFAGIDDLNHSGKRGLKVFINDRELLEVTLSPEFRSTAGIKIVRDLESPTTLLLRPAEGSNLGPIINAAEIYQILDIQNRTHLQDVNAIRDIREAINVPDDWAGDPCLPASYSSTGLTCSNENPPRVLILNLTNAGLHGPIPSSIANLTALTHLILGNNSLRGSIPDLSSLKKLTTLDLQNNQLTGDIPTSLEELPKLTQLFLQNNKLSGIVPHGLKNNPSLELRLDPGNHFVTHHKSNKPSWIVGLVIGLLAVSVVVFSIILFLKLWGRNATTKNAENDEYHANAVEYTEEEIKEATRNYSQFIGNGSFGSVFYGTLEKRDIAVKVLSRDSRRAPNELQNEVSLLSTIRHKNLVQFFGYCREPRLALIYEYMHNGSLKDRLSGIAKLENPLDWHTRLNIAVQAAEGLFYLHNGCSPRIVHRDIKCENILLDGRMCAKVGDFGLSRLIDTEESYISTVVKGSPGYLDPEYFENGTLTEKSDVYSFGVVLLEILSGTATISGLVDSARKLLTVGKLHDLMDPCLGNRYNIESAWKVAEVAHRCVEKKSANRPKMGAVVKELGEAMRLELENKNECSVEISLLPQAR